MKRRFYVGSEYPLNFDNYTLYIARYSVWNLEYIKTLQYNGKLTLTDNQNRTFTTRGFRLERVDGEEIIEQIVFNVKQPNAI